MPADPVLVALAARWPELGGAVAPSVRSLADRMAGSRWRVIPSPQGVRYEDAIAEGSIPTREHSWHDAFNVHAFAEFPRAKAALHARMRTQPVIEGRRTREGDALALLDETALVFAGTASAIAELDTARASRSLAAIDAVVRRHPIALHVFGHALYEHRVLARPPIGAGVVALALAPGATVDDTLAEAIAAGRFATPSFAPYLPWPDPQVDAWLLATLATGS